ncbi:MAG: tetratricopeptide repeat protein [Spirochaetia bacterium]
MKTKKLPVKYILSICLLCLTGLIPAQEEQSRAVQLYRQGESMLKQGDYFRAIELFDQSLELNPGYKAPLKMTALAYLKLGELDEAAAYIDRAKPFAQNDIDLTVLETRIEIIKGNFETADKLIGKIQSLEPKNREAQLLAAELAIARGEFNRGISKYQNLLRRSPENKTALLALIVMNRAGISEDDAEELIETALTYYWDDPQVHLAAAEYYLDSGDLGQAELSVRNALSLRNDYLKAVDILSTILYKQGRYLEALDTLRRSIEMNPAGKNWYLIGQAHYKLGNYQKAVTALETALNRDTDDYIARVALEEIIAAETELENPKRSEIADYHIRRAEAYSEEYRLTEARLEYRRALGLYPYSVEARLGYAETFLIEKFRSKYLQELSVLTRLGMTSQYVEDRIEIYQSILRNSPAKSWNIDQFLIEKDRIPFSVYQIPSKHLLSHPEAPDYLLDAFNSSLLSSERIKIAGTGAVRNYAEAFRRAREAGSDFFLLVRFQESDRSFAAAAEIYVSRTGTRTGMISAGTSGNDRVGRTFLRVTDDLEKRIPLTGTIIRKDRNRGLINLGAMEGLDAESVFTVIKGGALSHPDNEGRYLYPPEAVLGTFTVTGTDDLISEGNIVTDTGNGTGLYDLITTGDTVISIPPEEMQDEAGEWILSPVYRELMELPILDI